MVNVVVVVGFVGDIDVVKRLNDVWCSIFGCVFRGCTLQRHKKNPKSRTTLDPSRMWHTSLNVLGMVVISDGEEVELSTEDIWTINTFNK